MRRRALKPFVWPLALLVVAAVLLGAGQVLARVDGFRLYGTVQAYGEIVGVIGLVWLVVAVIIFAFTRRRLGRSDLS